MRSELTYRGALNILGRYDRPRLEALNRLLGGAILLSPLTGIVGLAGSLVALWGWVDQKNEAVGLVHHLLDEAREHADRRGGLPRQQIITAAHTVIVGAAFFDSFKARIGDADYKALELTKNEILVLALDQGERGEPGSDLLERLYASRTPMPSACRSFEEICENELRQHYAALADATLGFLEGLAAWRTDNSTMLRTQINCYALADAAIERYADYYRRLISDVPEFQIWAMLNEHGGTRHQVRAAQSTIDKLLAVQTRALVNTEELLKLVAGAGPPAGESSRDIVHRMNRSTLKDLIAPADSGHAVRDLMFPAIDEIYVNPRYQVAVYGPTSMPSTDSWWAKHAVRDDLEVFLAGHFMSHESTEKPLLVLGHPGAGKSLVTKVLAARLPVQSYTVVRVPLRKVDANVPIYMQIQKALNDATHGRVEWSQLTDEAGETVRVVLLDGLDELIQATKNDRSGYLYEVAEFQRREADLNPVAVVVTSRTTVSDHIRIPDGSTVIRIREFDDHQVGRWLDVWNRTNSHVPRHQKLELQPALKYSALATQPLLLMMLAIYAGDVEAPPLDAQTSRGALYGRLLNSFIVRELSKAKLRGRRELDAELSDHFWRLSIAAFGMFNRGKQSISDAELGSDLKALTEQFAASEGRDADSAQVGQRTIGQFFFIHTSEADGHRSQDVQRSYEFLHSTFGEYMIARHIVEIIKRMAGAPRYGPHNSISMDDSHLYALLSHQPLTMRRTTLSFLREASRELSPDNLDTVHETLSTLMAAARRRQPGLRYDNYRPTPVDRIREFAAYSVNLVLLRVFLATAVSGVHFHDLMLNSTSSEDDWRSLVRLWRAGLDATAWDSIVETIMVEDDRVVQRVAGARGLPHEFRELGYAQMAAEPELALELRAGRAAAGQLYLAAEDRVQHQLYCYLVFSVLHGLPSRDFENSMDAIMDGIHARVELDSFGESGGLLLTLVVDYLARYAATLSYPRVKDLVSMLGASIYDAPVEPDGTPTCPRLAMVIAAHPTLLTDFVGLRRASLYLDADSESWIWLVLRAAELQLPESDRPLISKLRTSIQDHLFGDAVPSDDNVEMAKTLLKLRMQ